MKAGFTFFELFHLVRDILEFIRMGVGRVKVEPCIFFFGYKTGEVNALYGLFTLRCFYSSIYFEVGRHIYSNFQCTQVAFKYGLERLSYFRNVCFHGYWRYTVLL